MTLAESSTHSGARAAVLIDVAELREDIGHPCAPQLLDVRWTLGEPEGAGRLDYLAGHLPGARFLDLEAVLTGPTTDPLLGRHPLPDVERVAAGLASIGVDPELPVVVYDDPGSYAAGRAWWVLRWMGVDVRVLDGGIIAWLAAGGELEAGDSPAPLLPLGRLVCGQLPTLDEDEVAAFSGLLIDARAPERYRGEIEPIDPKAGHIPGAVNRPVVGFWDADGRLPSEADLRQRLALPSAETPVAVYCGSGVSAAQVVLALASLGIDAALYPASWSGWSSDPNRPVEVDE